MSEQPAALLPIFRSQNQLRLLAFVFLRADRQYTLADLARATGIPPATVSREVERLVGAGILRADHLGRAKLVEPNREAPYFADLRSLLIKVAGPPQVLSDLLAAVDGIDQAYIFGSWARRYLGEPGEYPRDIDLLVIGNPDVDAVYDAAKAAEDQLGVEVNPTIVSPSEWEQPTSVFLEAVRRDVQVAVLER